MKKITITGKWEGTVELADPLDIEQATIINDSLQLPQKNEDGSYYTVALDKMKLPAILACVVKWELKGFPDTVDIHTFPASPRKASHELIDTIHNELVKIFTGETEIPNE